MQGEPPNPCHVLIKEGASDKWAILILQPSGRNCAQPGDPLLAIDKSEVCGGGGRWEWNGQFYGAEPFPCGVCAHFS